MIACANTDHNKTISEFVKQMYGYNSTVQGEQGQNRAVFTFDPNLEIPNDVGKSQES